MFCKGNEVAKFLVLELEQVGDFKKTFPLEAQLSASSGGTKQPPIRHVSLL